jgi:hypothetical protein
MGKISDLINDMINVAFGTVEITSANPNHTNTLLNDSYKGNLLDPDFEQEIENIIKKQIDTKKESGTSEIIPPPDLSKVSEKDIRGLLGKVGIDPMNMAQLAAMSGGKGGLGMLTKLGGVAGVAGPLAVALMIKPVTEAIIKELQRPGGFLDKRVKIDARNEAFAELDRQTRQNTRIGDRQVVIQQFEGFRNYDGFASTNTSNLIKNNADRVLDIGLFDRAQGVK